MDDHELRRSEKRFRVLVQHASELMLVWDARGELIYAGPATIMFATGEEPDIIEGADNRAFAA
jgi:PAS domain-containing protein